MSRIIRRGPARLDTNLTSLVDVVFILIVFFVLVAHISRAERFRLDLPRLVEGEAGEATKEERVVVNVVPAERAGAAGGDYRVGARAYSATPDGLDGLADLLSQSVLHDPDVTVVVRAARGEPYERVAPALRACALAGVRRAGLAAEPEEGATP